MYHAHKTSPLLHMSNVQYITHNVVIPDLICIPLTGLWLKKRRHPCLKSTCQPVTNDSYRVLSSEISSNLSGNLLKDFSHFLSFKYNHVKNKKITMFLTNNSADVCVLILCIMFKRNNLLLARLPRISAYSKETYVRYNFQALANNSGKFTTPDSYSDNYS